MEEVMFPVDFNEMVEENLVLLSKTDFKEDSEGKSVQLKEGMHIIVFEDESDPNGRSDMLIAEGSVVLNPYRNKPQWSSDVKWCCRINANGIYRKS